MPRRPEGPRPTLQEMRRTCYWLWLICERCLHRHPAALAPYIIRWRQEASSDMLRNNSVCARCGNKGASLQHPSWVGIDVGFAPFPADWTDPVPPHPKFPL